MLNQLLQLLAWTGYDNKFITLKLGKYDEFCPIEEYLKLTENIIPSDDEIDMMLQDEKFDLKYLIHTDCAPISTKIGKILPL